MWRYRKRTAMRSSKCTSLSGVNVGGCVPGAWFPTTLDGRSGDSGMRLPARAHILARDLCREQACGRSRRGDGKRCRIQVPEHAAGGWKFVRKLHDAGDDVASVRIQEIARRQHVVARRDEL